MDIPYRLKIWIEKDKIWWEGISANPGAVNFLEENLVNINWNSICLLYTSPSPRDRTRSRMQSSA